MKIKCPHCEVEYEAVIHEDPRGVPYRAWYSGDHRCPKLEGMSDANNQLQNHFFNNNK